MQLALGTEFSSKMIDLFCKMVHEIFCEYIEIISGEFIFGWIEI